MVYLPTLFGSKLKVFTARPGSPQRIGRPSSSVALTKLSSGSHRSPAYISLFLVLMLALFSFTFTLALERITFPFLVILYSISLIPGLDTSTVLVHVIRVSPQ